MCSCDEKIDYLVINTANANMLLSVSETDFVVNMNLFNLDSNYETCDIEVVGFMLLDSTGQLSDQILGTLKIHSNIQTMNTYSSEPGLIGVIHRFRRNGSNYGTNIVPIKTKCKVPFGNINIKIKDFQDQVFGTNNVNNITIVFKISYHEKPKKLLG